MAGSSGGRGGTPRGGFLADLLSTLSQAAVLNSQAQRSMVDVGAERAAQWLNENQDSIDSWMDPLNNISRVLGSAISGQNPFRWGEGGVSGPMVGEALVNRGVDPTVAALAEFLVPDPTGAKRVTDLIPLVGMLPLLRAFRNDPGAFERILLADELGSPAQVVNEAAGGVRAMDIPRNITGAPADMTRDALRQMAFENPDVARRWLSALGFDELGVDNMMRYITRGEDRAAAAILNRTYAQQPDLGQAMADELTRMFLGEQSPPMERRVDSRAYEMTKEQKLADQARAWVRPEDMQPPAPQRSPRWDRPAEVEARMKKVLRLLGLD